MKTPPFLALLPLLALVLLTDGCATAPPLKAFPGHPQAVITGAAKQAVVERLISVMQSRRYELKHYTFVRDQGYRIRFAKEGSGGPADFLLSRILEASATAHVGVEYEVRESEEGLRISARVVAEGTPSPPGGEARELVNAENYRIQEILAALKADLAKK